MRETSGGERRLQWLQQLCQFTRVAKVNFKNEFIGMSFLLFHFLIFVSCLLSSSFVIYLYLAVPEEEDADERDIDDDIRLVLRRSLAHMRPAPTLDDISNSPVHEQPPSNLDIVQLRNGPFPHTYLLKGPPWWLGDSMSLCLVVHLHLRIRMRFHRRPPIPRSPRVIIRLILTLLLLIPFLQRSMRSALSHCLGVCLFVARTIASRFGELTESG